MDSWFVTISNNKLRSTVGTGSSDFETQRLLEARIGERRVRNLLLIIPQKERCAINTKLAICRRRNYKTHNRSSGTVWRVYQRQKYCRLYIHKRNVGQKKIITTYLFNGIWNLQKINEDEKKLTYNESGPCSNHMTLCQKMLPVIAEKHRYNRIFWAAAPDTAWSRAWPYNAGFAYPGD